MGEGDERGPFESVPVLRDYALIADGERGALVDELGGLAWMCFPGWGDQAVFAGLLGSGGAYRLTPVGRFVYGGYYEDGTLIWHSRWVTDRGIVDSREALAFPGDPRKAVVLRRVEAVDAPCKVRVQLQPAAQYGRRPLGSWSLDEGTWSAAAKGISVRWTGAPDAVAEGDGLFLDLRLSKGESRDLVLELVDGSLGGTGRVDADAAWRQTEVAWREAVPSASGTMAERDVRMGIAVLRGMTTHEGGTVAAATTSLPERVEASRNYDYRYCWVRDMCYIGHAGGSLEGAESIMDDALRWLVPRVLEDGPKLKPAYLSSGGDVPAQEDLHLPGYPGGHDVVGNQVRDQFQLDAFGEVLLLLARAAKAGRLDAEGWRAAEVAKDAIEARRGEPDEGVWETDPKHWTHSRLICVAGLRSICSVGAPRAWATDALSLADRMLSEADRSSLNRAGHWQRAPDDDRLDASLLLAQIRGAVPVDDVRSRATLDGVVSQLTEDGYVYRYRVAGKPLGDAEGAFLVCSFWLTLALLQSGDTSAAAHWFERARAACGSPGLFSEEFDVAQRQLRGNLPQAFVHALLIEAAGSPRWG